MSHFVTLVFYDKDKSPDDLLAKYDENISMAPYIKYTREQAIAESKSRLRDSKEAYYDKYISDPNGYIKEHQQNKSHIEFVTKKIPERLKWSDDEHYEYMKEYFDDDMIDSNGNLLSTYNPDSKWDWYSFGGRWSGYLKLKNGEEVDDALVEEVVFGDAPFAFVDTSGGWHERGEMGWFGISTNDKEDDVWEKEFKDYVQSISGETCVSVVDCHI